VNQQQIGDVWNLLLQSWGQKFAEQYGATPNQAWAAMLEAIEVDAARAAFKALVLSGSPFPPTLPEFLAEARKFVRVRAIEERNAATMRALGTSVSSEKAQENLARLRALLNS